MISHGFPMNSYGFPAIFLWKGGSSHLHPRETVADPIEFGPKNVLDGVTGLLEQVAEGIGAIMCGKALQGPYREIFLILFSLQGEYKLVDYYLWIIINIIGLNLVICSNTAW